MNHTKTFEIALGDAQTAPPAPLEGAQAEGVVRGFDITPPEAPLLVATDPDQQQQDELRQDEEINNEETRERTGERADIATEPAWAQRIATLYSGLGRTGIRPLFA